MTSQKCILLEVGITKIMGKSKKIDLKSAILFQGKFSKNDVICKFNEASSRKIDPIIEKKAQIVWQKTLLEAKEKGKKIWDQPVYRLEKYEAARKKCKLEFSTIPFSIRSSFKDYTEDLIKKGSGYLPMATYSSIFIETASGSFVFGEKSDHYMANRKFTYIGGVFNRSEEKNEQIDIFRESENEVKEELEVASTDITYFRLLGAFRSESLNVGFIFYCKLKLTDKELMKKFEDRNDNELKSLFFVKRDKVRDVGVNVIGKEPEMVDIFENNIHE